MIGPSWRFADAAVHIVGAPGLEPWDYGWVLPEYRASASAALAGPNGPVTISPEGRGAYAKAVELLSREASVRERWDLEELWGVVASLVAGASNPTTRGR